MVGQGPNHLCQEALKPTKVAIKELDDCGQTCTDHVVLGSLVFGVDRWGVDLLKSFQSQQHPKCRHEAFSKT